MGRMTGINVRRLVVKNRRKRSRKISSDARVERSGELALSTGTMGGKAAETRNSYDSTTVKGIGDRYSREGEKQKEQQTASTDYDSAVVHILRCA